MKLYIGENLKRQRKEKDLTQEQLADILGVSFQSVSKWERGEGYPDMELLPVIAEYFGITVDELMGMKEICSKTQADKILEAVHENSVNGRIEENLEILENAIKRFPNNYQLLEQYAVDLTFARSEGETERQNNLKAAALSERILSECSDPAIRSRVQSNLCTYYERSGQTDKALDTVGKLPSMWCSAEIKRIEFLKGEELTAYAQSLTMQLAQMFYVTLLHLADPNAENVPDMTRAERIRILQKAAAVYDIVFDEGDHNYYFADISHIHFFISRLAALDGDRELALSSIEKAAGYAAAADDLPDKKPYTSLLVNKLQYNRNNTVKNFTFTYREELSEKLGSDIYDPIRNDPRFRAVTEALGNSGGSCPEAAENSSKSTSLIFPDP